MLHEDTTAPFIARGLDPETADRLGASYRSGLFRFRYHDRGTLRFTKMRPRQEADWRIEPSGQRLMLWNLDQLRDLPCRPAEPLVIPAGAQEIAGRASVIDGDTIEIHGQRIRLFGIDAVEGGQLCQKDGKPWRCAQASAFALDRLLQGKTVRCIRVDLDRYGRIVARCTAAGVEVNAEMVRLGWAMDFPKYSRGTCVFSPGV